MFSVAPIVSLLVGPAAATTCMLAAPATDVNGTQLAIVSGSGFPAKANVDISFAVERGSKGEISVQSAADGTFQINMTQDTAVAGTLIVVATVRGGCTARAAFDADGSGGLTLRPGAAAGATSAPRTDAADAQGRTMPTLLSAWLVGALMVLIGVGGLIATRPARGR